MKFTREELETSRGKAVLTLARGQAKAEEALQELSALASSKEMTRDDLLVKLRECLFKVEVSYNAMNYAEFEISRSNRRLEAMIDQ